MRKIVVLLSVFLSFALFGCGGGGGGGGSTVKAEIALKVNFDTAVDVKSSSAGKDAVGALYSDGTLIGSLTLKYGTSHDTMTSVDVLSSVKDGTPVTLEGLTLGSTYIFSIEAADAYSTVLCSGTAEAVIASVTNVNLSCDVVEADSYFKAYSPAGSLSFDVFESDVLPDGSYVITGVMSEDNNAGGFEAPFVSVYSKTMSHKVSKYFIDNNSYTLSEIRAVTHDTSGNIYVAGLKYSSPISSAVPVIIKFDSGLNILWSREVEYGGLLLPESTNVMYGAVPLDSGGIAVLLESASMHPVIVRISSEGNTVDYQKYETQLGSAVPVTPVDLLKDPSSGKLIIVCTSEHMSTNYINLIAVNQSDLTISAYKEYYVANTSSGNAEVNYTAAAAAVDGSGYVYVYMNQTGSAYYPGLLRTQFNGTSFSDSPSGIIYDNANNAVANYNVVLGVNDTNDTVMLAYVRFNESSPTNNYDFSSYMVNLDKDFSFNWMNILSDPSGMISMSSVGAYPLSGGAFAVLGQGTNYGTYYGGTVLAKLDSEGQAGNFGSLSTLWSNVTEQSGFMVQFSPYTVMSRTSAYTMSGSGGTISGTYVNTLTNGATSSYDFTDTFISDVASFISYLIN